MKILKTLTILLISTLLFSCFSDDDKLSTNTTLYSDDFETAKDRVEELKKHVTFHYK